MQARKILCFLLALFLLSAFALPAFAETERPKVVDEAGLLTNAEAASLKSRAETLADTYSMDVVILTNFSLEGKSAEAFADDYFDYNGYGIGSNHSGILLLVSMNERDWAISTCGDAIDAVTDYGNTLLQEAMLSDLSAGNYYEAFDAYLDELEYLFRQYAAGSPVDVNRPASSQRSRLTLTKVLLCVAAAALIGGIATGVMVSQMTPSKPQNQANAYVHKDSFHLADSRDIFLYSTMTKTRRQQTTSGGGGGGSTTHHSSSGRSHGGSHGKF